MYQIMLCSLFIMPYVFMHYILEDAVIRRTSQFEEAKDLMLTRK